MKRRTFLKSIAPLVLPSRLVFAQSEVWEPGSRSSQFMRDGNRVVWRCRGESNPLYCANDSGLLVPIDFDVEESVAVDGKLKKFNSRLPMRAGVLDDSEADKIVTLRCDKDWKYPERQITWSLVDAKFDGIKKMPNWDKQQKISKVLRKCGDDYAVYNDRTTARLLQRIPATFTSFEITYRLELSGLVIVGSPSKEGFIAPDENGEFRITTSEGEFRFRIRKPKLLDEKLKVVSDHTEHTIRILESGVYEYVKRPSTKLTVEEIAASVWIDADTYYSTTADGRIYASAADWASTYGATTGNVQNAITESNMAMLAGISGTYTISRSFFYFDLSSIASGVTYDANVNIYGYSVATTDACVQKGTQGSVLQSGDMDSFEGSCYGHITWSVGSYKTIPFNSQGNSDVTSSFGGTFYLCAREYTYDYLNQVPSGWYRNGAYYAESVSNDPYLTLTVEPISEAANPFMGVSF